MAFEMLYLGALNGEQLAAVTCDDGPNLVLAGAGSGKTRVLTYRIAHLILNGSIDSSEVLAVTFTNKAAREMQQRIYKLLTEYHVYKANELWISTFHSACAKLLRAEIHKLGYANNFTIYDDTDQLSLIKNILKRMRISDAVISPKFIQEKINKIKNSGLDFDSYKPTFKTYIENVFVEIFYCYSQELKNSSALDFSDLILKPIQLFKKEPQTLEKYQKIFTHLFIDEYQDTNKCQYELIKTLAGKNANIYAVGDEDQSIYRWRGAEITNILNFERDFPNAKIFKLEKNYRSTRNIIEAASAVIANNMERFEKNLWTDNSSGEKISVIKASDEQDEAYRAIEEILKYCNIYKTNQIAIFYRTNAQSRALEDMLRARNINYEIYGGLKFYERAEIKDILAYLRLIVNPDDDVSFRRIVNVPSRGIGNVSIENISELADKNNKSLYRTLSGLSKNEIIVENKKKFEAFIRFYNLIEYFKDEKKHLSPNNLLNLVIKESGYKKMLLSENTLEALSRLENLDELSKSIMEYEERCTEDSPPSIEGFLQEITLSTDIDSYKEKSEAVKLMTIHMSKGLEFDFVIIVGLEEELFPNIKNTETENITDLEEERRLFYVGMTRARKKLTLMYASKRKIFGMELLRTRSRFIDELPSRFVTFSGKSRK